MKSIKLSAIILFLLACKVSGLDRYGGQYNVVPDTSPYTFNYRFYIDPGKTGVNNFEYRAMMDDIYALWSDTSLSECSRWKAVNILLEKRVDPYLTYPIGVSRSSVPFDSEFLNICQEGKSFDDGVFLTDVVVEAEDGKLYPPMEAVQYSTAPADYYIQTSSSDYGTAAYVFNVSSAGIYYLVARAWAKDWGTDSFYISMDGDERIFDTTESIPTGGFKWIQTMFRPIPGIEQWQVRTFDLTQGTHILIVRGRESGSKIDAFYLTKTPEKIIL